MDEFFTPSDLPALLYNEISASEADAFKRHIARTPQLSDEFKSMKVAYNALSAAQLQPSERSIDFILHFSKRSHSAALSY